MAHNLNQRNGKVSFASKKEKAWHGLGTIVDAMSSKEAIELGGLNFKVEKRPLFVPEFDTTFDKVSNYPYVLRGKGKNENGKDISNYASAIMFPDKFAVVREDNGFPLGIVGTRYEVIQNSEAFDFIDSIIGEGVADYETVGCLGNGETVFITCKLREELIINKDLIDKYLLLTMSHDGTGSIVVMFTPIRVVCNNTLSLALKGNVNKVTIKHTKNAKERLELSKKVLGIVDQQTLTYKEIFADLYKIQVPDEKAKLIISTALSIKPNEKGELSTKAQNIVNSAWKYYQIGVGQEGIVGTGWGVFNGITGFFQNVRDYKDNDSKFTQTFFNKQTDIRNNVIKDLYQLK